MMTDENLQAGTDLDRRIAQEVMGWKRWQWTAGKHTSRAFARPANWQPIHEFDLRYVDVQLATSDTDDSQAAWDTLPNYSTKIQDAWCILDRLDQEQASGHKRYRVYVANSTLGDEDGSWCCKIVQTEPHAVVEEYATTVALAICAAELKLTEVKP